MTDTTVIPEAPTFETPGVRGAISGQDMANAIDWLRSAGVGEDRIQAALNPAAPASQEAPKEPAQTVSLGDKAQAAIAALKAGGNSDEAIAAVLARSGLPNPDDGIPESVREYDRMYPEVKASDYRPDFYGKVDQIPGDPGKYLANATTWAASIDLPQGEGEHLIEQTVDLGNAWSGMSDADRSAYKATEWSDFKDGLGGEQTASEAIALVATLLANSAPEFRDHVLASGALHSAAFVRQLHLQAERLVRRAG